MILFNRVRGVTTTVLLAASISVLASQDTFVADYADGKVYKFGSDGTYKGAFGSGFLNGPISLTFAPDGKLYVVNYSSATITRFDSSGNYQGQFGSGFLSYPTGVAVGPDGLLYVICRSPDKIVKFDPVSGNYHGIIGSGFFSSSAGIGFHNGILYACASNKVFRFEPVTGNYLGTFGEGFLSTPWGIAFSGGDAYVSSYGDGSVTRFDAAAGTYKGRFGTGFSPNAAGLCIDSNGQLSVGSLGHQWVTRLETDGTYKGYYGHSIVHSPYGITSGATIYGKVTLQDYLPYPSTQQITFEVRPVGSTTPSETVTAITDNVGNYSISVNATGPVDLAAKAGHWLRKVQTISIGSGPVTGVNYSLINGDVDGDNAVTIFDYSALSTHFDMDSSAFNWNTVDPNTGTKPSDSDLDGDEFVSIFDYSILSTNFDMFGDP